MSAQMDLFEAPVDALSLCSNLKTQQDAIRRKFFAEISDLKKEIEFLSLQLQMVIEERDANQNANV